MKRIILLVLVAMSFASCELGDDRNAQLVLGPVQDVTMAATYRVDSVSQIIVRCVRPTDCHLVNGFYYDIDNLTRTVAMQFAVIDGDNCQDVSTYVYEIPLNFKPRQSGTYLFRFWDGQDINGEDHFFEAEAIVP